MSAVRTGAPTADVAAADVAPVAVRDALVAGARRRSRRWWLVTGVLVVLVLGLAATMLMVGERTYSLTQVLTVLGGGRVPGASFTVGELRLPRTAVGLLAGAALGMAGCTVQTLLRNPLASPDIIGITSGSSAAAVFCIVVLGASQTVTSVAALVAGVATAAVIAVLARGGQGSGGRMVLIGIGVGAMLDAVVSALLLRASQWDVPAAMRWLTGSLNGARPEQVPPLVVAVVVLGGTLVSLGRRLRALELGDPAAVALGVRVDVTRVGLVLAAVGLAASATAVTGPIAFVAFLAGPIAVRLLGGSGPALVPAGLVGAALVLGADLLGQHALRTTYPVGVVTGVLGAPYLLLLLTRLNRSGGAS